MTVLLVHNAVWHVEMSVGCCSVNWNIRSTVHCGFFDLVCTGDIDATDGDWCRDETDNCTVGQEQATI